MTKTDPPVYWAVVEATEQAIKEVSRVPDPESVGNESQEETEAGIDRMYEKTDPTPTVDLEELKRILDTSNCICKFGDEVCKTHCDSMPRIMRIAIKLAEEVERLRLSESIVADKVMERDMRIHGDEGYTQQIAQMREALEKIEKECRAQLSVGIGLSTGYNATIHEIARAALKEKKRGPDEEK